MREFKVVLSWPTGDGLYQQNVRWIKAEDQEQAERNADWEWGADARIEEISKFA